MGLLGALFAPFDAAAVARPDTGHGHAEDVPAAVLAALARDLDMTEDQARQRLAVQERAVALNTALRGRMGKDHAGSWLDADTGRLTVAATRADQAPRVVAAGADVRVVRHGAAALAAISDDLGGHRGGRGAKAVTAPEGVVGWYTDPAGDRVVVTIRRDAARATLDRLAAYGDAVVVARATAQPTATWQYLHGGDAINGGNCSNGFNVVNPTTSVRYLITAGHCVTAGGTVTGQDGSVIGPVVERWFPGFDDALVRVTNTAQWVQGPWVDTNPSNGAAVTIDGYSDGPVGAAVCKSGVKTRLTCGHITGKDQSVLYDNVNWMYGLTRFDACVEKGDSGGSVYQTGPQNRAEGVVSGATLDAGRCLEKVGLPNVSFYYPIADSLAYYGPRYGVVVS
ncbi:alpha-lytic protease prodomain-containing protein [Actinophytocola oryzae]|uniref:Alpha-lytic protease prodomain-containing protein n=2 Tax=Actinophytocola oryzae TaxID=502181 RepID=A0A4R7W2X5_9PSEU|nr:alpha-lytic protease prodomain-containing protein [Actinophytocola oryzae]